MWLAVATVVVAAAIGAQGVDQYTTNGSGGPVCPPGRCNVNAQCLNGECVCQAPYVWGDGRLCCLRRNQVNAKIYLDPTLKTFNNDTSPFPYPCRYLVTDVKQELKINKQVVGFCRCQVHAYNARHLGKIYPHGYDYSCNIVRTDNPADSFAFSIRKYGCAQAGSYTFNVEGSESYTPNGPWNDGAIDLTVGGVRARCEIDQNDNIGRVFIRECGLDVYLRPYDKILRRQQPQLPGISIGVNCAHHPEFFQHDRVMALAPKDGFGGQLLSDLEPQELDIEDRVLIRALLQGATQSQPDAPESCDIAASSLHYCNDAERISAARTCFWILRRPRFIRCMNGPSNENGEQIMNLLSKCINWVRGTESCIGAQQPITDHGCWNAPNTPELGPYGNCVITP